jgi:hypothetical protein
MSTGDEAGRAIARGVAFLEASQLASGEIPVLATTDPSLAERAEPDPSVFPTAVAAQALSLCPEASAIHARACRFLLDEKDPNGLWRHWTRGHEHAGSLPPDLDDTSCASAALAAAGTPVANRDILLANRRGDGLFLTWVIPRLRWTGAAHARAWLPQLAHLPTLAMFFRETSASPDDADAVVNANALFYLRDFDRRDAVIGHLLAVLRDGREAVCDKWYENRFIILYFLSRALKAAGADAAALVLERLDAVPPAGALESALAACVMLDWGRDPAAPIASLLAGQNADGSWPRAALYHGGRERRRDGSFAPRHPDTPHWGSEALTTCFCLEALSRRRGSGAAG